MTQATQLHVSQDGSIDSLIRRTQPTGPGQRNRRVFDLARGLIAILGREADREQLRRIVLDWHRQALPIIRTKAFDETWGDFVTAWDRIKRPAGMSLAAAVAALEAAPLPAAAARYDTPAMRRLVALGAQLAVQWGAKPFPLGCVTAGKCIGVSKTEAHRLLKTLAFDGVIELVTKGTKATGRASEWRFKGGQL